MRANVFVGRTVLDDAGIALMEADGTAERAQMLKCSNRSDAAVGLVLRGTSKTKPAAVDGIFRFT